jgi:hypothetical protein
MAGYACLVLVPLALVWSQWSSARAAHLLAAAYASLPAGQGHLAPPPAALEEDSWESGSSAPAVLLSIEPVGTAVDSESETLVVFPGYLLPAESDMHEEPAHAGS